MASVGRRRPRSSPEHVHDVCIGRQQHLSQRQRASFTLCVHQDREHTALTCARNRGVRQSWRATAPCGKAPHIRTPCSCGRAPCSQLAALSPPPAFSSEVAKSSSWLIPWCPTVHVLLGKWTYQQDRSLYEMGSHLLHPPLLFVDYSRMSRV